MATAGLSLPLRRRRYSLIVLRYAPSGVRRSLLSGQQGRSHRRAEAADRKVTQSGYPEDHLDNLYSHQVASLARAGANQRTVASVGHPAWQQRLAAAANGGGWRVIAVQSSAPGPQDRWRADNHAIAVTGFRDKLEAYGE